MMLALEAARDALATIPGLAVVNGEVSCKVGMEANISPAHYPMIRLVPSRITPGRPYGGRTAECLIYFGAKTANSQGLELVYAELMTMEAEILRVLKTLQGRYIETITDEDRLDAYKLMVVRCEIGGAQPTP